MSLMHLLLRPWQSTRKTTIGPANKPSISGGKGQDRIKDPGAVTHHFRALASVGLLTGTTEGGIGTQAQHGLMDMEETQERVKAVRECGASASVPIAQHTAMALEGRGSECNMKSSFAPHEPTQY
jgi:hypothetical protein